MLTNSKPVSESFTQSNPQWEEAALKHRELLNNLTEFEYYDDELPKLFGNFPEIEDWGIFYNPPIFPKWA